MALQLSSRDIVRYAEQAKNLKNRAQKALDKSHETVEHLVRTAEVATSAFALGVVQGKYGKESVIMGVPIDLGAGLAAHLAAIMGIGGHMAPHLHAFGDGALACYLSTLGMATGLAWRHKGQLGSGGGAGAGNLAEAGLNGPSDLGGGMTMGAQAQAAMDAWLAEQSAAGVSRPTNFANDTQWFLASSGLAAGQQHKGRKATTQGDGLTAEELKNLGR